MESWKKKKTKIIPPGQFFRIKNGNSIKKIARKGLLRDFQMGEFGYGEFTLNDWKKKKKVENNA
ncbi:MAG: hypothetical protein GF329_11580 [Candidatus Lokiarchaeota archaeon]|nr:hypothetical protein [Candidatus Lokiarchaeota archaeon]